MCQLWLLRRVVLMPPQVGPLFTAGPVTVDNGKDDGTIVTLKVSQGRHSHVSLYIIHRDSLSLPIAQPLSPAATMSGP